MIRTVLGDMEIPDGPMLVHEHLQIDLSHHKSAEIVLGPDQEHDVTSDLAHAAKQYGLSAIADLTTPGGGRNIKVAQRISRHSGVAVVAAAGFYWEPPRPIIAGITVDQLAAAMTKEIETGAEGTDIRCGVIKIGTNADEVPNAETTRLFHAAARTAMATGVSIITHTERADQANWHIEQLGSGGMDLSRVLISHMHKASSVAELRRVTSAGAFVGFDQIGFASGKTIDEVADFTVSVLAAGLIGHLIVSSDVARFTRLTKHGGTSFSTVFARFLGLLKARGVSDADIKTLLHENPRKILSLH